MNATIYPAAQIRNEITQDSSFSSSHSIQLVLSVLTLNSSQNIYAVVNV